MLESKTASTILILSTRSFVRTNPPTRRASVLRSVLGLQFYTIDNSFDYS